MRYSGKFGRYLRSVRESKGYSQEYMADRLGIGQSAYACIESGRTCMTVERLIGIAAVLEVDLHVALDAVVYERVRAAETPATDGTPAEAMMERMRDEISFLRQAVLRLGRPDV